MAHSQSSPTSSKPPGSSHSCECRRRLRFAGVAGGDRLATASVLPVSAATSFLPQCAYGVLLMLLEELLLMLLEELLLMAASLLQLRNDW
jgi:hypothetical protein